MRMTVGGPSEFGASWPSAVSQVRMFRGSSVQAGEVGECFRDPGRRIRWAIVFCIGLGVVGCATATVLSETPMNTTCLEVPTVEECRTEAAVIEDVCLRECVEAQCSGVKVVCDPHNQQRCKELNEGRKGKIGGFVTRKGQTCLKPKDEVAWCQLPMSRRCRAKAMVHELAHSCGWSHGDGSSVPGETGELPCK